ncbi:MAG: hypothetical protein ACI8WB_002807 [Phenylobacterium sp.]|jgi:hypothetical protein
MRIGFMGLFVLLFTLQAFASVIELEAVSSHDQIHHELETGHVNNTNNTNTTNSNTSTNTGHQPQEHIHLCHHHHGEHTAKLLIQPVDVAMAINYKMTAFVYSFHYENISPLSLYRPPIV